jgi:hypothetical protein
MLSATRKIEGLVSSTGRLVCRQHQCLKCLNLYDYILSIKAIIIHFHHAWIWGMAGRRVFRVLRRAPHFSSVAGKDGCVRLSELYQNLCSKCGERLVERWYEGKSVRLAPIIWLICLYIIRSFNIYNGLYKISSQPIRTGSACLSADACSKKCVLELRQ